MNGLVPWSVFGFMVIMIFAIVSNSGQTGTANIQTQLDRLDCASPDYNNGINATEFTCSVVNHPDSYSDDTITIIPAFVIYNLTVPSCVFFSCGENGTQQWIAETAPVLLPIGYLTFSGDVISSSFDKGSAWLAIVGYILTPINFDVWGYTLADIGGIALMVVIGLYIFAYIPIAILIYKAISPFTGLG